MALVYLGGDPLTVEEPVEQVRAALTDPQLRDAHGFIELTRPGHGVIFVHFQAVAAVTAAEHDNQEDAPA